MDAKIDSDGILWINRNGTLKQQRCGRRHDHFCRDCCALFGEPSLGAETEVRSIKLCAALITGIILDERLEPTEGGQA